MACDRCGAVYYDNQIQQEWTGLMVCFGPGTRKCWEPRHPVDYLRSIPDDMGAVSNARPRQQTNLTTITAIKVAASSGATSIDVDSTTGMVATYQIGIELDNSEYHWTTISSVTDSDTVVISTGLPSPAAVDREVHVREV